jgi:hypothetical protein
VSLSIFQSVLPRVNVAHSFTYKLKDGSRSFKGGFEHSMEDKSKIKLVLSQSKRDSSVSAQFISKQYFSALKVSASGSVSLGKKDLPLKLGTSFELNL